MASRAAPGRGKETTVNYRRMRVAELRAEMARVEEELRGEINREYPGLLQWLLPPPYWRPTKGRILRWLEEAPEYASRRISEAYGIGVGPEWLAKFRNGPLTSRKVGPLR
jgi:hypothetical protein